MPTTANASPPQEVLSEYARMNKPREIEGVLDTYLIRPMGYLLVRVLRHTPVTPNQLSVLSVLAAFGAALSYLRLDLTGAIAGLGFMLLTSALDSADGQLARATGRGTELGRTIDGVCDNLSFAAIYICILVGLLRRDPAAAAWAVPLCLAAGLSHSFQSSPTDFARCLWSYHVLGARSLLRERPEILEERLAAARAAGGGRLSRFLLRLNLVHCRQQRRILRSSDRLEREASEVAPPGSAAAAEVARRYREEHGGLVGWWWLGATNVHKVGIVAAAFVHALVDLPGEWGMTTYFVYDVLLNLPLCGLILLQRRADQRVRSHLLHLTARKSASTAG